MKVLEPFTWRRGVLALVVLVAGAMPAAGAELGDMAAAVSRTIAAYPEILEYGLWMAGALAMAAGVVKSILGDHRPGAGKMLGLGTLFPGLAVLAAMGLLAVEPAAAKNLGDMAKKGSESLSFVPAVVEWLAWIIGAILVLAGFYKLKKNTDNPAQQSGMGVVMTIAAGVLMIVLPAAIDMVAGTLDLAPGTTIDRPRLQ